MRPPRTSPSDLVTLAKQALIVFAVFVSMLPFVWPLLDVVEQPITPTLWLLVITSALANVIVLTYHYTVPAHPKFVVLRWRRVVLRSHIISGSIEFVCGLGAILLHPRPGLASVMALAALAVHVPSALIQTRIVFGSRAIMRPAYLACIAMHAFCAVMLLRFPGSMYWAVSTFLVFNVYVWCRLYYYLFDKFGLFADSKYTVAILLAGLTTMPAVLGASTIFALTAACAVHIALYAQLFLPEGEDMVDFVRERARDSTRAPGVRALWNPHVAATNRAAAHRLFSRLDVDGNRELQLDELRKVFVFHGIPLSALEGYLEGKGTLDFQTFFEEVWPIREVRDYAAHVEVTSVAQTDRDKAAFVFEHLDLDGDGAIEMSELRVLLDEWSMPDHESAAWLSEADIDRSGTIGFDEFFRKLRPVWRFVYYDVVEAKQGAREDMIWRALTAHRHDLHRRSVEAALRKQLGAKLDGLSEAALGDLVGSVHLRAIPEGRSVVSEGDPAGSIGWIRRGWARLERAGVSVGDIGPSAWIGRDAVVNSTSQEHTVVVTEELELFELTADAVMYLVSHHPELKALLYGEEVKS